MITGILESSGGKYISYDLQSKGIILCSGNIFVYSFEHSAAFIVFEDIHKFIYILYFLIIYFCNNKT